jgi:hypothetical protein
VQILIKIKNPAHPAYSRVEGLPPINPFPQIRVDAPMRLGASLQTFSLQAREQVQTFDYSRAA